MAPAPCRTRVRRTVADRGSRLPTQYRFTDPGNILQYRSRRPRRARIAATMMRSAKMMSSNALGSTPERRTTSGGTAVMSVSGGVLANVSLERSADDRPGGADDDRCGSVWRPRLFGVHDFQKSLGTVSLLVRDQPSLRLRGRRRGVPRRAAGTPPLVPCFALVLTKFDRPVRTAGSFPLRRGTGTGHLLHPDTPRSARRGEHFFGDDDTIGRIFAAFSAQYRALTGTAPVVARSVKTPRCSTAPASMMSPVRRRRASTGPSR